MNNIEGEKEQEFYFAVKDAKGKFIVYTSEKFKLSEIDIINLIKLCYVDRRSKSIGEKTLEMYKDSTETIFLKKEQAIEKLKKIGIKNDEEGIIRQRAKTK